MIQSCLSICELKWSTEEFIPKSYQWLALHGKTADEVFASFYLSVFSVMTTITLYAKQLGESTLRKERVGGIKGDRKPACPAFQTSIKHTNDTFDK